MGGNVLGVLHSFGYVRGLLNGVGFGERRRLKSVARMSVLGLAPPQVRLRAPLHGDRHTSVYLCVCLCLCLMYVCAFAFVCVCVCVCVCWL